jgi:hypothetical protein
MVKTPCNENVTGTKSADYCVVYSCPFVSIRFTLYPNNRVEMLLAEIISLNHDLFFVMEIVAFQVKT